MFITNNMAFKSISKNNTSLGKSKQKALLVFLFVLFLIALVIMYFSFWRSSPIISIPGISISQLITPASDTSVENVLKEIDFDISFVKSSQFQELRSYGEWPLKIEEKGRSNPFQ